MNRNAWIGMLSLSLVAGLVAVSGCNTKSDDTGSAKSEGSSAGHVATVDLDKVATGLGWDKQMKDNVGEQEGKLKAYYADLTKNFTDQLKDKMKTLGIKEGDKIEDIKKRVPEDKFQEFVAMTNQAQQMAQMADRELGQVLQKYRSDWAVQYRNALDPTIHQVAKEKKATIVLANGGQILFTDGSVDLTDEVIAATRKSPPALTPVKPVELKPIPAFVPGAATDNKATTKP